MGCCRQLFPPRPRARRSPHFRHHVVRAMSLRPRSASRATGFPTYPFFAEILAARQAEIRRWPSAAAIFLPEAGTASIQADLARTLRYMADRGKAENGAAALPGCTRHTMRSTAATCKFDGGSSEGEWRLAGRRGSGGIPCTNGTAVPHPLCRVQCLGCGRWSRGPMVLEALNALKGLDHFECGTIRPPTCLHTVAEALKLAAPADREVSFGDRKLVR